MSDVPPATLTEAQREQFTRYPELDEQLLARHYLRAMVPPCDQCGRS